MPCLVRGLPVLLVVLQPTTGRDLAPVDSNDPGAQDGVARLPVLHGYRRTVP